MSKDGLDSKGRAENYKRREGRKRKSCQGQKLEGGGAKKGVARKRLNEEEKERRGSEV